MKLLKHKNNKDVAYRVYSKDEGSGKNLVECWNIAELRIGYPAAIIGLMYITLGDLNNYEEIEV